MTEEERKVEERFLHYHFSGAEAMQQLNKISIELTQQEVDLIVLEMRPSLENASLEEIGKRVIELSNAFITLQREAKRTKQKHILALESYRERSNNAAPEEIQEARKKKKLRHKSDKDWERVERMFNTIKGEKK